MTEAESSEVEKVLLFISDAQERARRAADRIEKDEAEPHVVEALRVASDELSALHRRLMQGTYYAVPTVERQLTL